jgi:RimJ/RimL family protein N-acetyltransferase
MDPIKVWTEADTEDLEVRVTAVFERLKQEPWGTRLIPSRPEIQPVVELLPFTADRVDVSSLISRLTRWRSENQHGFPREFEVTNAGTRRWADELLICRPDRMLFLVRDGAGTLVGHVGVSTFDFAVGTCEIDNIVRGERGVQPGAMTSAVLTLCDWIRSELAPSRIQLRTMHENTRALALYHRLGFVPFALFPLKREEGPGYVQWSDAAEGEHPDRFFLGMRLMDPPKGAGAP